MSAFGAILEFWFGAEAAPDDPTCDARTYARAHADIVERFGRFPHRNAILGRDSTEEESAFLKTPGSRF